MQRNDLPPPSRKELRHAAKVALDRLTDASDALSVLLLEQHFTQQKLDSLRVDISMASSRAAMAQIDYDDSVKEAEWHGAKTEEAEEDAMIEKFVGNAEAREAEDGE